MQKIRNICIKEFFLQNLFTSKIETFKLLKGIAKLNYSIFFKLSVRRHIYKIVKNCFCLDVTTNFFSNMLWMHEMSCLSMWLMQKLNSFKARIDKFHKNVI